MRSTGDGTAAGGPFALQGGAPAEPALKARVAAQIAPPGGEPAAEGTERVGYRGPTACAAAGITYRQLDYWARTGLVEPSVRPAYGSGSQRLYSFRDVVVLKIVKRLLDTGVSLQNIRAAVQHLRARGLDDLAQMTLMSDGATVYECTSPDEVVDLLQGGQGVFGIAVGVVWRDVESALSQLHGERVDTGETLVGNNPADELARRRNRAG
ncbi:MerR family transcriptional regulator [Streptomyces cucumeris]|uniref:MerR family transcriptional regulator n=1 Tax=Streptomyces cucumeris TaxID=2962890 RepID=UPI003D71B737